MIPNSSPCTTPAKQVRTGTVLLHAIGQDGRCIHCGKKFPVPLSTQKR